jgi:pimeloyl-ACP methyl ester carboxylesterase
MLELESASYRAPLKQMEVLPQNTHSNIDIDRKAGDTLKHQVFFNRNAPTKNKLLVFIPGTGANPKTHYTSFCKMAANAGYHAIALVYKNKTSISSICGTGVTTDKDCSENARLEIIYGQNLSTDVEVDRFNSIEFRLQRLLLYLDQNYPNQDWEQFLNNNRMELRWNKIAFAGHSQGGGHIALIARDKLVHKVLMFNSPSDRNLAYQNPLSQPAWFYDAHITPNKRYYAFYHQQNGGADRVNIYKLFGLGDFGNEVNVDVNTPPFNNSHILFTDKNTFNYGAYTNPTCKGGNGFNAHSDIIVDCEVPYDANNNLAYQAVWWYMLND